MRNFTIAFATTLALASTALVAAQGTAQQPPSSTPSVQQPPSVQPPAQVMKLEAKGQLVRVDSKAKTFTIRPASAASDSSRPAPSTPPSATPPSGAPSASLAGMTTEFTYSDSTKVTGSEKTVEGLATMAGTDVTVRYSKQGDKNVASEIEIHAQTKS